MIKRKAKRTFSELFDKTLPYVTPLSKRSLESLYQYGIMANKVEGLAADAGVYTGTSLFVLANVFDREIHAFDSFEGLPELSNEDQGFHCKGQFLASLEDVKKRLYLHDTVVYHKGFFSETFDKIDCNIKFSYAFCDVDLYQSVTECFEFFYPRMNPGGVLIFDDYFCGHTPGAKVAIDKIIATYGITDVYQENCFVIIET